jgi:hypothetical protein
MPRHLTVSSLLIGLVVSGRLLPAARADDAKPVQFVEHTIVATGLRSGYQVVVTDLNKDGRPDIIALATNVPELAWYENPAWERHVMTGGFTGLINAAVADLDKDGIPEVAVASGFTTSAQTSVGIVSILTHGADPAAPWTLREIDRVPTAHRLRWVDAEGTGTPVLVNAPLIGPEAVAPDYKSPMSIYFYRAPEYKRTVLADASGLIHGIEPVTWPGVKGQALLSAGFLGIHLNRYDKNDRWTRTELNAGDPTPWPKSGSSDTALGRLGTQRFIGAIEPWHGFQVAVYREEGNSWKRHVIDADITDGHTLVAIDVDNDGRDELVAGQRGGARSLVLYTASKDGDTWSRRVIDEGGMAGAGCAAADLNADRRPDIVCIGSATQNLKWYENLGGR